MTSAGAAGHVVVTGAAGSMGRAVCHVMAPLATLVVGIDIEDAGLAELARDIDELGTPFESVVGDLSDWAVAERTTRDVIARHGSIKTLVMCAGGYQSRGLQKKPFWECSPAEVRQVLGDNLTSTAAVLGPALEYMVKARSGSIVCIASGKGLRGGPGLASYSAAKAAVIALVQATAVEAGPHGPRVNSIAPGATEAIWRENPDVTPTSSSAGSPLGRRTTPQDVAHAVRFLTSDDAAHITGACLDLSGGTALH